jgi:hypothetical protein
MVAGWRTAISRSLDPSIALQARQPEAGRLVERFRLDIYTVTDPCGALEADRADA